MGKRKRQIRLLEEMMDIMMLRSGIIVTCCADCQFKAICKYAVEDSEKKEPEK